MKALLNTVIIFLVFLLWERFPMSQAAPSSGNDTALTTGIQRGSASPKPTQGKVYNAERRFEFDEQSSASLHSRVQDPERNNEENIWDWDFWCQLQPKTGKCSEYEEGRRSMMQSFYYNAVLDSCKPFRYSGCDGNKNNFQTIVDCELHCKEANMMRLKEINNTSYCDLQPNAGSCMALLKRYYYDVRSGECKKFTYGGCGGNQNRFESASQCNRRCKLDE